MTTAFPRGPYNRTALKDPECWGNEVFRAIPLGGAKWDR
jgi:hypothetical protein